MIIYIASPYTKGDPAENVSVQIDAAHRILDMGHTPIAPLLSHFLHIHRQRPYTDWLAMDLALITRADILLRLPSKKGDHESPGADAECGHAKANHIPVAWGWSELDETIGRLLA